MSGQLDLRQLAIDRTGPPAQAVPRPRHLVSRYVVPAAVLLGLLGVMAWAARDRLLPSRPVTVAPVIVKRGEIQRAGTPLFQAPGWVEPRPTPVLVSALAEGVVEELLVVEGQEVKAGEPVARLVDTDARLALEKAQADLRLREAELSGAQAELAAARTRLEQPVHLEAAVAEADYLLAQAEGELASLPFEIRAAEARLTLARQELEGKQAAGSALAGRLVQRAQSEFDSAASRLEELKQRRARLEQECDALRRKRDAHGKQQELKIEEKKSAADAEAGLEAAGARLRQAQLAVDTAKLQLERMVVRAPAAGRVLKLHTEPGRRAVGLSPNSLYDASTVVSLYDPNRLQLRCDVRLEDVPLVEPGQPVRIETPSVAGPIEGDVLFATSSANVQKNTLEVKVAVKSPPPTLRPEMLVQATFLAPATSRSPAEQSTLRQRLFVPRQLVDQTPEGSYVWLADAEGIARRQRVELGGPAADGLVEVTGGVKATDKLISGGREALGDNQRIRIAGEDTSLGINSVSGTADRTSPPGRMESGIEERTNPEDQRNSNATR